MIGFDPSARVSIGDGREQFLEAVLERLDDGVLVQRFFDDDGELVMTVSLRRDFLVRVERADSEAAA